MNVLKHNMRKHRFHLYMAISELINIPQLAGKVYVKIQIRNKGSHSNSHDEQTSKSMGTHVLYQSQTEKEPIENNKVTWNYQNHDIILKIGEDQKTGLMENKWLLLKVYVEYQDQDSRATSSSNKHPKKLQKVRLGKIAVNLTEYINFSEMTTNRYLLADSKINSICKISILMKHLDDKKTNGPSSGYSSYRNTVGSPASRTSIDSSPEREFNVPQLETSHIFQGLNQVIDEDTNSSFGENNSTSNPNSALTSPLTPTKHRTTNSKRDARDQLHFRTDHTNVKGSENQDSRNKSSILTDPTLNYLVSKTLQYSWFNIGDDFYPEFTPSECVEDIFYNGTGWKRNEDGVAFIDILHGSYENSPNGPTHDSEVRSQWITKMQQFDEDEPDPDDSDLFNDLDDFDHDKRRRTPKLLGLADLRDDLKSWHISLDPEDKKQI
ncbi:hypothetical protein PP7435_CHR2-0014 [Komagataella phaffii CBS 7435]|uniref:C2 NT-type domain-containing protein n=2 Tax=Komagataella phaffii TaxID=460519 RepID=C4R344_KOMPG|nr:uncharacterized protein PAS_chr2-2_0018 [Komagataella phaffii GS115]AOA62218.1 GQ67_01340T0 [Komagataella phaffii]CAH2447518.1 hypothetical protein BQ9382_C2-0076 [Komagataella phaffii CBS 7435]AOA67850.1 GQ68_00050T0 [Komagataella phaffii GS115]CAY69918.1 Protein of unknown function [Komagataella phaffii GS115]CCA37713.1 hypothetical protein PP7435_CHR2-0014 [Komagataella phaffii CBS 7435]